MTPPCPKNKMQPLTNQAVANGPSYMDHGVSSCLALSAPTQHPINHPVLRVLKLALRMVCLRLAVAKRPKQKESLRTSPWLKRRS